jgi:hypothetical protein
MHQRTVPTHPQIASTQTLGEAWSSGATTWSNYSEEGAWMKEEEQNSVFVARVWLSKGGDKWLALYFLWSFH